MTEKHEDFIKQQVEINKTLKGFIQQQIETNKLLAETQASLAHLVNGLHDKVYKKNASS